MATPRDITGRDRYLLKLSLIYAIAHIQSLPKEDEEWDDMCDMCAILRAWRVHPNLIRSVEIEAGVTINLDPDAPLYFGVDEYAAQLEASR